MSFLGRAKKMMGGFSPPDPSLTQTQYYRVTCPEGHNLRGARTEGYQAIRCPSCGEGVFILPRSPLPDPPAPPGAAAAPRAATPPPPVVDEAPIQYQEAPAQLADAEIEWEDAGPEDEVEEAAEVPAPKPAPRPAKPPAPKPRPRTSRPEPAQPPPVAPPEDERGLELPSPRPARGRRNRAALLILGVVGIVAITIGLTLHRQRRQNLPRIAETNRLQGLAALKNGVVDVAKQKLAIAASALESLGDAEAASIRQSADEAAILADLASLSVEEIVEEVATKEDGPSRFETLYQGRALILDAEIEDEVDGVPSLTYRIIAGTGPKPKTGFLDLAGFHLLADRKKGDHVTFGARLASIKLRDDGRWAVALQPKSGVYIRSPEAWKALETFGWSADTTGTEVSKP